MTTPPLAPSHDRYALCRHLSFLMPIPHKGADPLKPLKIALTDRAMALPLALDASRIIPLASADLTEVSAVVMTSQDTIPEQYETIHAFAIPLFLLETGTAAAKNVSDISCQSLAVKDKASWKKKILRAATQYEKDLLPPFFDTLVS